MAAREERTVTLSADNYSMWILDWKANQIRIVMQSGEVHVAPMDSGMRRPSDEIARTFFDWDRWWLTIETEKGHLVVSEVWSPVGDLVKGRPSVYLDQNHWSTIAKTVVKPEAVSAQDRAAAQRLIKLGHDGGIRLPLSSATLQETAALFGDRRYEVGITIASLSGGWQLRDPLELRRQEFAAWFAERLSINANVPESDPVTLEPGSVFGDRVAPAPDIDLSDSMRRFMDALTWPSVLVSILIDSESIPSVRPTRWADSNGDISKRVASLTKPHRSSATTLAAIRDNEGLMSSALSLIGAPSLLDSRLGPRDIADAVANTRFGGLYTAVMAERHRDPNRRWWPNDLNDIMFLTCAATYCDYVAAERSTGRQLMRLLARRNERLNVYTSLPDLVEALDRDDVRSVSEGKDRHSKTATNNP
ncbi:hypothetical protein [Pseudoclavibacter sp. VKM Ac-2867]|uniref:hypothetical protein n=1 Tax=Pseudoclavibacter sp. VKM Ac-2867 TaxID=2783829 RepID=UPI00188C85B5|nr:hypothetical protein [Pseudoclavibacter sp. VKM Ac-2867]MBF4459821.1 hypothetical protein [Pseudoclavibacter sp. VKM Ac-2867]